VFVTKCDIGGEGVKNGSKSRDVIYGQRHNNNNTTTTTTTTTNNNNNNNNNFLASDSVELAA